MTSLTSRRDHVDTGATALLVLCCLIWGLAQVAAKVALPEIPPLTQVGLRSGGAFVLLLAFAAWRGVPLWQRDGTLAPGVCAGVLFAAEFACIFAGLQHTGASRMAVLIYLSPFVVALGMPFIAANERLGAWQWGGLALAFGGVVLAMSEGLRDGAAPAGQWKGDLLGVLAAVLWGMTTLLVRASRLATAAPAKTLAYQLGVSAVLLPAAGLWAGETLPLRLSPLALGSLAFQTVVVSFASYLAWFWLVRHYPATRVASFTLLTPVAGLAFGVLLLDEPLTWALGLGFAAVAAGIMALNRRPPSQPAASAAE